MGDEGKQQEDIQAYLARIRKSVADGEALVRQAEARMAETDRLLASQGYTREQVLAMKFSDEQIAAVNAELVRRGLEPIPPEEPAGLPDPVASPEPISGPDGVDEGRRGQMLRRMKWMRI